MNNASKKDGLFARQKASKILRAISSIWSRIRNGLFLTSVVGLIVTLSSCDKNTNAQNSNDKQKSHATIATDSLDKPKVSVQVNKRYDDKGNLIGFDSTYSSFYSNVKGDTIKMDSLMHSFDSYFNRNHSSYLDKRFNTLFFDDSLRYPDFFHNDFFLKRYELNDKYLRETMGRMDSIKNRFFHEHSRGNQDPNDL